MANGRKWTQEEDEALVQAVTTTSYNLHKCFVTVAAQIDRTPVAVFHRWYRYTRFTSEGRKAMFTVGKDSTYGGKNYTPRGRVKPTNTTKSNSLWNRLLKILGIK